MAKFTIEHKNKTDEYQDIDALSISIYEAYLEKRQNLAGIENINCAFYYNVKNWSEEYAFTHCLNEREKKSSNTDIQWSVFIAMVDTLVKNKIELLKEKKIALVLTAEPQLIKPIKTENKLHEQGHQSRQNENVLNVEPVKPRYKLSQLVLPNATMRELREVLTLIQSQDLIYNKWGFAEVDQVARTVINLYGPPGTGKTMAAHGIANELNLPFLPLNYSDIESKFVGDAPKNLVAAFKKAKETNSVLFFDEADSFLGKRITSVSSSSDQAINSLRSQMLILLESYDIITIFASNLKENYDKAFESRILKHIRFELPDANLRIKIIDKHIPEKAPFEKPPLQDSFWQTLGKLSEGLSPRQLKNLVRNTLVTAAASNAEKLTQDMFIEVFTQDKKRRDDEHKKMEEKKESMEKSIQHKLKNKDYKVIKNRRSKR